MLRQRPRGFSNDRASQIDNSDFISELSANCVECAQGLYALRFAFRFDENSRNVWCTSTGMTSLPDWLAGSRPAMAR